MEFLEKILNCAGVTHFLLAESEVAEGSLNCNRLYEVWHAVHSSLFARIKKQISTIDNEITTDVDGNLFWSQT
jgi:hypothetical protein